MEQTPVEHRARTRTGVQQDMVSSTGLGAEDILNRGDPECLDNGLWGKHPQPVNIVPALAAVKLGQVDYTAVQQAGHCLCCLVDKYAHRLNVRVQ